MSRFSLRCLQRPTTGSELSNSCYCRRREVKTRQQSTVMSIFGLGSRSGHDPLHRIIDILADLNRHTSRVHLPLTRVSAKIEFRRVISRMLNAAMVVEPTGPTTRSYLTPTGLRKIEPYWYPYTTMAKGRWLGREMLEVVSTEFRDRSIDYYVGPSNFCPSSPNRVPIQRYALESGVTTVNGGIAKPDTIIKNGDRIELGVFVSPQCSLRD